MLKLLHRMSDKVYLLYWKGEGQDHILSKEKYLSFN